MKGDLKGGKLIGEGSSTCVFQPNLPCKNKNIKIDDGHVSKLFLKKTDNLNKEINFNKRISKLSKYKEWAVVLHETCEAPDYETIKKHEPDIDKCLKNNKTSSLQNYQILYGEFGGIGMDTEFKMNFVDTDFLNINKVEEAFLKTMKKCEFLFLGLKIKYDNKK